MRSFVPDYDLVAAKDLSVALELLITNEGWRPIAGGTDLMVLFNAGNLPYRRLVSVRDIAELRQIEISDEYVEIGAAATYTQIRNSSVLQFELPLLWQAASWIGGRANQNRGTLGGNIANASPAADSAPVLLVYDAELELTSSTGRRLVPYSEFHLAYKEVDLRPYELITRIRVRRKRGSLAQYAHKIGARNAQAISKVCFAAVAERGHGVLRHVRIAVGSVAPVPLRCIETEKVLEHENFNRALVDRAKQMIRQEIRPITDIRSTDQYRRSITVSLLSEFLESLVDA